jgi:hypothetical protein
MSTELVEIKTETDTPLTTVPTGPEAVTREVAVSLTCEVQSINDVEQSFEATGWVDFEWKETNFPGMPWLI